MWLKGNPAVTQTSKIGDLVYVNRLDSWEQVTEAATFTKYCDVMFGLSKQHNLPIFLEIQPKHLA